MSREKEFTQRNQRFFQIPEQGINSVELDREYDIAKTRFPVVYGDEQWAKPGTLPDPRALEFGFDLIRKRNPNLVEPTMFLGAWEIEREAISMLAGLLHHPHFNDSAYRPEHDPVFGWFTDSGTSSFHQAALAFRNRFFRDLEFGCSAKRPSSRGVIRDEGLFGLVARGLVDPYKPPVILAPTDMHFCGDKSIEALGLGADTIVRYGFDKDFRTDYKNLEGILGRLAKEKRKIIFSVATAGAVDSGRVEDVQMFSETLKKFDYTCPIIVDAAQQYMMLATLSEKYPKWDFRVEDVGAMIIDPHKTDAAPYPASVVLFRDKTIAVDTQSVAGYLHNDDHIDYDMKTLWQLMPQFSTSRSPLGATATWAFLLLQGKAALRRQYQQISTFIQQVADYVRSSEHYTLLCPPQTGIVSFHVKDKDDFRARAIYHSFEENTERPRFYISFADNLRVLTPQDFQIYNTAKHVDMGKKVNGFGGLYIQVMQHATAPLVNKLCERLDKAGYETKRK